VGATGDEQVTEGLRALEREEWIAAAVRDERVNQGPRAAQSLTPSIFGKQVAGKDDEPCEGAVRVEGDLGGEHGALREAAHEKRLASHPVVALELRQGGFEGGARGGEARRGLGGEDAALAALRQHLKAHEVDFPPRPSSPRQGEGCFGEEPAHGGANVELARKANEVVAGRAEAVAEEDRRAVTAAEGVDSEGTDG
jgi:hypothetical protein